VPQAAVTDTGFGCAALLHIIMQEPSPPPRSSSHSFFLYVASLSSYYHVPFAMP